MIYESSGTTRYDSVAQLDRVTDYESVGLGFESLLGHHKETPMHFVWAFLLYKNMNGNRAGTKVHAPTTQNARLCRGVHEMPARIKKPPHYGRLFLFCYKRPISRRYCSHLALMSGEASTRGRRKGPAGKPSMLSMVLIGTGLTVQKTPFMKGRYF